MAREYILTNTGYESGPPKPISDRTLMRKCTAELRGICKAFLLDGKISAEEANALWAWIKTNPIICGDPMANALVKRLARIYSDAIATQSELTELQQFLVSFTSDTPLTSSIPFDSPLPTISFQGISFCFTGKFISGSRQWCEESTAKLGGYAEDNVTTRVRYLVIGSIPSPAWANMNYGTKIENAIQMRDKKKSVISIVPEEHWIASVSLPATEISRPSSETNPQG